MQKLIKTKRTANTPSTSAYYNIEFSIVLGDDDYKFDKSFTLYNESTVIAIYNELKRIKELNRSYKYCGPDYDRAALRKFIEELDKHSISYHDEFKDEMENVGDDFAYSLLYDEEDWGGTEFLDTAMGYLNQLPDESRCHISDVYDTLYEMREEWEYECDGEVAGHIGYISIEYFDGVDYYDCKVEG